MAKKSSSIRSAVGPASRRQWARRALRYAPWRWINLAVSFLVLVLLASPSGRQEALQYTVGAPLPQAFVAPFDLQAVDERARREALDRFEQNQYFRIDTEALQRSRDALDRILNLAREAGAEGGRGNARQERPALGRLVEALHAAGFGNPEKSGEILARRATYGKFASDVGLLLRDLYEERGVIASSQKMKFRAASAAGQLRWTPQGAAPPATYDRELILGYPEEMESYLRRSLLPPLFREDPETLDVVRELLTSVAEPVVVLDTAEKDRVRRDFVRGDGRFSRRYEKGTVVFRAGQAVGEDEEQILRAFRARMRRYQAYSVLGTSVFVGILFALVALYAKKYPGETPFTASDVALVSLPTIISFGLWRVLGYSVANERLAGFGFPSGLIGMLGATLLGPRLAWLLATCAGLLYGMAAGFNFEFSVVALFGGYAAITSLYSTQTRRDILVSGAVVGLVNALVILAISFMKDPAGLGLTTGFSLLFGAGNGIACATLALPLLWVFERSFGVVTDFTLLELTGIHHPLLRELEQKAPGTFQHTLNVTKLAESAALAIGANSLLVRAGSYFHDVGKMDKPRYFSENQVTQEDRSLHAKLSPYMSTLIIKNHIKEGMEIARRYKVPPQVAAFIPEHQGTCLISYFYNQALKQFQDSESTDPVREEDFRYPGPKPQSIETAIVMLADTAEATVTSVFTASSVDEDDLRQVVRRSIAEKFDDGQFDECDLTLRDLHIIHETFVKTLLGRFHHRVAYPIGPREGLPPPGAPSVRRAPAPARPAAAAAD